MTKRSRILDEIHESAHGFHRIGLIDDVTLKEFDALCLPPVKQYSPKEIKALRERCRVSQGVFAAFLNVGKTTVAQWEQGVKKPGNSSRKLLDIVDRKGIDALA